METGSVGKSGGFSLPSDSPVSPLPVEFTPSEKGEGILQCGISLSYFGRLTVSVWILLRCKLFVYLSTGVKHEVLWM